MFNTVNAKLWIILILLVLMYEKKTFDASLMSADEKDLWNKSFDNTPGGIQSLLAWIADYQLSLSEVLFCAENWNYTNCRTKTWWDWEDGLLCVRIWSSKSIKHKVIGNILPDGKVSWCDRIYFFFGRVAQFNQRKGSGGGRGYGVTDSRQ